MKSSAIWGPYSGCTPDRPKIEKYNTENNPARAATHFAVPKSQKQQQDSSLR